MIDTLNSSGIAQAKEWLGSTAAQIVLVHELQARGGSFNDFFGWARRNGWKTLHAEYQQTDKGGASAGVAILVREWLGLRPARKGPAGHVIRNHRLIAGVVSVPGFRDFLFFQATSTAGTACPPATSSSLLTSSKSSSSRQCFFRQARTTTIRLRQ